MPTSKVDKAIERSQKRAEFRQAVVKAGAESQVKISRERGRQRRSVERTKTRERVIERQQSEKARVEAYAERSRIIQEQRAAAGVQRLQTQADLNSLQRKERFVSSAITGTQKTVTRSSTWETLVLIATLFFVMVIMYIIVTNGEKFGQFTGGVGKFISGLSSNTPLFVAK